MCGKKKAHNIRGLMLIWEPRKSSAFYKKKKIKKKSNAHLGIMNANCSWESNDNCDHFCLIVCPTMEYLYVLEDYIIRFDPWL